MITVEALQKNILQRIQTYNLADSPLQIRETISLPISQANNHILAQKLVAGFDVPRQNLSAMDGFAIATGSDLAEGSQIKIIGEVAAGKTPDGKANTLKAGQGVRIFTGAVVPNGCDTVVMQENTNFATLNTMLADIKKTQTDYQITLTQPTQTDKNIRKQGEEIKQNDTLLNTGKRLNPTDITLLASMGIANVTVYKPLTVGIIATGDELQPVGNKLHNVAQIYNSNTPTLQSLLADLPVQIIDYGITPDDLTKTKTTVANAVKECDVIISTAGVSVGDYDFLTEVITELGQINHHKVAMKPGKPFVFGELVNTHINDKAPVIYFGLPGNPLSAVVGCLQFIMPALWQMSGMDSTNVPQPFTLQAKLQNTISKKAGRLDFQRGLLTQAANGAWQVEVFDKQQSHRVKQLSQANCLVLFEKDATLLSSGDMVNVQPFKWALF